MKEMKENNEEMKEMKENKEKMKENNEETKENKEKMKEEIKKEKINIEIEMIKLFYRIVQNYPTEIEKIEYSEIINFIILKIEKIQPENETLLLLSMDFLRILLSEEKERTKLLFTNEENKKIIEKIIKILLQKYFKEDSIENIEIIEIFCLILNNLIEFENSKFLKNKNINLIENNNNNEIIKNIKENNNNNNEIIKNIKENNNEIIKNIKENKEEIIIIIEEKKEIFEFLKKIFIKDFKYYNLSYSLIYLNIYFYKNEKEEIYIENFIEIFELIKEKFEKYILMKNKNKE
jgi:hypothetical protein